MRNLFFLTALIVPALLLAQPSDADIKKEITNSTTKQIKFTKTTGTRQWNSDYGNWEWVRGVEVIRTSDYPGIDVVVTGDVVYQYTGTGKYSYWKFRVLENKYLGIANPPAQEITAFISKDWPKFYGHYFQKITKLHSQPALANEPRWTWHSPNSVSFLMTQRFDFIASAIELQTIDINWDVRLYRDDPKSPWKNGVVRKAEGAKKETLISSQKLTYEQAAGLKKQTLAFTFKENEAKNAMAVLPQVTMPPFTNAEEMVRYVHDILRNGTPEKLRAVLVQLLHPNFFEANSTVQLKPFQEEQLQLTITNVYNNKVTYQQLYCQQPEYRTQTMADGNRKEIYIKAAVTNCTSAFTIGRVNTGYKEGVAQTALKITNYGIAVRQDADAINFINSFSNRKNLCKQD
jgi:hypothetical protein